MEPFCACDGKFSADPFIGGIEMIPIGDPQGRARLDTLRCEGDGCTEDHGPLVLHAGCHLGCGVNVSFFELDGQNVAWTRCSICSTSTATILVKTPGEQLQPAAERCHDGVFLTVEYHAGVLTVSCLLCKKEHGKIEVA
jgi:hypothetical protein